MLDQWINYRFLSFQYVKYLWNNQIIIKKQFLTLFNEKALLLVEIAIFTFFFFPIFLSLFFHDTIFQIFPRKNEI